MAHGDEATEDELLLHPEVKVGNQWGRACRDSELGGYYDSYPVLSARQVNKLLKDIAHAKSSSRKKKPKDDADEEKSEDDERGGSHCDIRRSLTNGGINIARCDINNNKTECLEEEALTPSWVAATWGKLHETMSKKLPMLSKRKADIPPQYGLTAVELQATTPYSLFMNNYLNAFAEYYTKGRDPDLCLSAVKACEDFR